MNIRGKKRRNKRDTSVKVHRYWDEKPPPLKEPAKNIEECTIFWEPPEKVIIILVIEFELIITADNPQPY